MSGHPALDAFRHLSAEVLGEPQIGMVVVAAALCGAWAARDEFARPSPRPLVAGLRGLLEGSAVAAPLALVTVTFAWIAVVLPNRYLELSLHYLAARELLDPALTVVVLGAAVGAAAGTLPAAARAFSGRLASPRDAATLSLAVLLWLLLAAIGGFWLNRLEPHSALHPVSLLLDALWLLAAGMGAWLFARRLREASGSRFMSRRLVGASALAAWALLGVGLSVRTFGGGRDDDRPNLVLVSIDTLRADRLGCYGHDRPTSPNLDRLATGGVRFSAATAQAPWTLPSHVSLLTGLYPSTHGVVFGTDRLVPRVTTLAEILRDSGYRTAAFTGGGYLNLRFGYQGWERFIARPHSKERRNVEKVVDAAVDWLATEARPPFFLFVHTYQVHAPFDPPARDDLFSGPFSASPLKTAGMTAPDFAQLHGRLTDLDYGLIEAKYDGEIHYTDRALAPLLSAISGMDSGSRTLVVVTSDHGENFSDHRDFPVDHRELYEAVVHVPLILAGPGLPAGLVVDDAVEVVDLMPTLLDLLGVPAPTAYDGESMRPLLAAVSRPQSRATAFSEQIRRDEPRYVSLRDPRWKLLQRRPGLYELYDLVADPEERHDLVGAGADVPPGLLAELLRWDRRARAQLAKNLAGREAPGELDESLARELRALGYL